MVDYGVNPQADILDFIKSKYEKGVLGIEVFKFTKMCLRHTKMSDSEIQSIANKVLQNLRDSGKVKLIGIRYYFNNS